MLGRENRASKRKRVNLQAFVTDLDDKIEVKCYIRDVSETGCKIVSSRVSELPDVVRLFPEGFRSPINAKVVWRRSKTAGLCFVDGDTLIAKENGASSGVEMENHDDEVLDLVLIERPLGYADRLDRLRSRGRNS